MSSLSGRLDNKVAGPLAGLAVPDMTTFLSGPFAAQILGDLGADIIKIEAQARTVHISCAIRRGYHGVLRQGLGLGEQEIEKLLASGSRVCVSPK